MTHVRPASVVVALALLTWLAPAMSGRAAASEDERARAIRIAAEGAAAYKAERYAEALAKFNEAYRTFPAAPLLLNISRAELRLGRCGDALRYGEQFRESTGAGLGASPDSPDDWLETLRRLCIDAEVTSIPPGAAIWIDGERQTAPESTPWSGRLLVGTHKILLWKTGYENREEVLNVTADKPAHLTLDLTSSAKTTSPAMPAAPAILPPAPTSAVAPRHGAAVSVHQQPAPRRLRWEPFIPAGVAVVGLAIAVAGGVLTKQCPTRVGPEQNVALAVDCQHNNAELADVGWGLTGAGAITAGILWFVLKPQAPQSKEAAPLRVSFTDSGIFLLGRF